MELYGVEFTAEQFGILKEVYDICVEEGDHSEIPTIRWNQDPDEEAGRVNEWKRSIIVEKLFGLVTLFICQRFPEGRGSNAPVPFYSAVLGIDAKRNMVRAPYNYTSFVAGLLWISRLLTLEHALPKHPYHHLNIPDRSHYLDWGFRLEGLRKMYLIEGSYSPVSTLVGLLAYGMAIARAEGNSPLVDGRLTCRTSWSNNMGP